MIFFLNRRKQQYGGELFVNRRKGFYLALVIILILILGLSKDCDKSLQSNNFISNHLKVNYGDGSTLNTCYGVEISITEVPTNHCMFTIY